MVSGREYRRLHADRLGCLGFITCEGQPSSRCIKSEYNQVIAVAVRYNQILAVWCHREVARMASRVDTCSTTVSSAVSAFTV